MPIIEATRTLKSVVGEYSFAIDGGAIGTLTLRTAASDSLGNSIPTGSVIEGGYIEVDTIVTSGGAATLGVQIEGAGDLLAATVVSGAPWSSTGRKSIIPVFSGATSVKTTTARSITVTTAAATLTAGIFRVVVHYR
jgi:hypothetical protein